MKLRYSKMIAKQVLIYLCMVTMMVSNMEGVAAESIQPTAVASNSLQSVIENVYSPIVNQQQQSTGKYLIRFKNSEQSGILSASRQLNLDLIEEHRSKELIHTNIVVADMNESELNQLLNNDSVLSIEPDAPVRIVEEWSTSSVGQSVYNMRPESQSIPWGNHSTGSYMAVQNEYTGQGIKVAVLDTGIATHEDLQVHGGVSVIENSLFTEDQHGHGTHVAGTIAALDNQLGIVGNSPGAELYSVKVLDGNGNGTYSQIIEGIEWSIEHGMNIISMSFAGSIESQALQAAIQRARENGILVVAAVGNEGEGEDTVRYPAHYPETIAVGSVDLNFQRSLFSSTGPSLDLVAPGSNILSTTLNDAYSTASGTSMAAAFVTSSLASLWSQHPDWSAQQVQDRIYETATPLGSSSEYGHGLVNVAKALGIIDGPLAPMSQEVGNYDITLPVYDSEGDVSVASYDKFGDGQTVTAGSSATVSLKLDGDQDGNNPHNRIDITVYSSANSNQILDSKTINNPTLLTPIQFTWHTSSLTPTGTYTIRYSYPAYPDGDYDDYFTVYVSQTAPAPDTYEPNDTAVSAYQVSAGQSYVSYISSSTDIDYYSIVAPTTGLMNLNLIVPSNKDFDLIVYDSLGNIIISGRESTGVTEEISLSVSVGTKYYLVVSGFSGTYGTSPYTLILGQIQSTIPALPTGLAATSSSSEIMLSWNAVPGATSYNVQLNGSNISSTTNTQYEITDLVALTSYVLGVSAVNANGSSGFVTVTSKTKPPKLILDIPKDVDMLTNAYRLYTFTPTATGIYKIFTSPFNGGTVQSDTVIDLYEDEMLTRRIDGNDDANGKVFSELKQVLISGVTYYVKMSGFQNRAVHARIKVTGVTSTIPFIQESIPVNIQSAVGDSTVYQFVPATSGEYVLNTSYYAGSVNSGPNDTVLEIFNDESLTQRLTNGFNDDTASSLFSEIKINLQAGTSYYIKVGGFQNKPVYARLKVDKTSQQVQFIPLQNKVSVDVNKQPGDKGTYSFTPTQSGLYRFYTSPNATTGEPNDTEILLYSDAALTNLINSNDNASDYQPYGQLFSRVEHVLSENVTYYVVVRNPNGYMGLNSRLAVEDSFHSTRSSAIEADWHTILGDEDSGLSLDISSMYDTDYYKVVVTEPVQVHINISANSAVLEDSNGNFKGIFSKDRNDIVEIKTPGVYYIRVQYFATSRDVNTQYNARTFQRYVYEIEATQGTVVYSNDNTMAQRGAFVNSNNHLPSLNAVYGSGDKVEFPYTFNKAYAKVNVEIRGKYNDILVYSAKLNSHSAGDYTFKWYGEVNENKQYASIFQVQFGASIDRKYYAKNGIYYIKIYADDPIGKKYPRVYEFIVANEATSEVSFIPVPPIYMSNGVTITSKNKDKCEDCSNYYYSYVYDFNVSQGMDLSYTDWLSTMYGPNKLERFWHKTEQFITYDDNLSPVQNIQKLLTVAGVIPVIGMPADGINGIIYLMNGDYDEAALSALSLIPVLEYTATGAKVLKGVQFFDSFIELTPCTQSTCIPTWFYLQQSETRTALMIQPPVKGSNSNVLGAELHEADLSPDTSSIITWDAHHIVPAGAKNPNAVNARDLLVKEFKIQINSVANGIWLPKKKGSPELALLDWDDVEVKISTHNGGHTKKYYEYVYSKINSTYQEYGPDGLNLSQAELTQEGVIALNEIRVELMNGTLHIGKVK